mmetsp:Transcript_63405/g.163140  ORF Transcript_63405/g.163140 Transcript_63405/m.163140 type:complete len:268 (-) Transcript_63405:971-1774(-)
MWVERGERGGVETRDHGREVQVLLSELAADFGERKEPFVVSPSRNVSSLLPASTAPIEPPKADVAVSPRSSRSSKLRKHFQIAAISPPLSMQLASDMSSDMASSLTSRFSRFHVDLGVTMPVKLWPSLALSSSQSCMLASRSSSELLCRAASAIASASASVWHSPSSSSSLTLSANRRATSSIINFAELNAALGAVCSAATESHNLDNTSARVPGPCLLCRVLIWALPRDVMLACCSCEFDRGDWLLPLCCDAAPNVDFGKPCRGWR